MIPGGSSGNPSIGNVRDPFVLVEGVASGDTVSLFADPTCTVRLASGAASSSSMTLQPSPALLVDGGYTFYAAAADALGNTSGCSQVFAAYQLDTVAPQITGAEPGLTPQKSKQWSWGCASSDACAFAFVVDSAANTDPLVSGATFGSTSAATQSTGDGPYYLHVVARDAAGNLSSVVHAQAVLDNTPPGAPTLALGAGMSSPSPNSTPSIAATQSGSPAPADTVSVYSGAGCASAVLASFGSGAGTYVPAAPLAIGAHQFSARSIDQAGNVSACSGPLAYDRTPRAAPIILAPALSAGQVRTGRVALEISGPCTLGGTLSLRYSDPTARPPESGSCGDADGNAVYTFSVLPDGLVDGTLHSFFITETLNGEESLAATLGWVIDSVAPLAPALLAPTPQAGQSFYGNSAVIQIRVGCEPGAEVTLTRTDAGATSTDSQTCPMTAPNELTFVQDRQSDVADLGLRQWLVDYQLTQSDGLYASSVAQFSWDFDLTAPPKPVLAAPSLGAGGIYTSGPGTVTFSGSCQAHASVAAQAGGIEFSRQECASASGTFSFTLNSEALGIPSGGDGQVSLAFFQTSVHGNLGAATQAIWRVRASQPSDPVITAPGSPVFYSNSGSLVLSGTCTPGYIVAAIEGSAAPFDQQTCSAGGGFSFNVVRNISAGTRTSFLLKVSQTDPYLSSLTSNLVNLTWILDLQSPALVWDKLAANPSYDSQVTLRFTVSGEDAGYVMSCSYDGAAFTPCADGVDLSILPVARTAAHTFVVTVTDQAGNVSQLSQSWVQQSYKTMALYHFNNAITDSSLLAAPNPLTNSGTANSTTQVNNSLGNSRSFSSASSQSLSSASTASLEQLGRSGKMTLEGYFRFSTLPSQTSPVAGLVSKGSSSAPGWEWTLVRSQANAALPCYWASTTSTNARYCIKLSAFKSGAVAATDAYGTPQSMNTNTWYHLAVTYNLGQVTFYLGGAQAGQSGTVGDPLVTGNYINASTATLHVGRTSSASTPYYFNGRMDELRLSQVVRWSANFSRPTTAYVGD